MATAAPTPATLATPPSVSTSTPSTPSSLSFTQGFLLGQLSIALLIFFFIKFFIFGEPPSADDRALHLSSLRRARTLAHQQSLHSLKRHTTAASKTPPATATATPSATTTSPATRFTTDDRAPSIAAILAKTYYNVHGHQPESLDWFNVLVAQTIAQLRADARHDGAILTSLTDVLNTGTKPAWIGPIRVTEIALGDEFPIFSNCRVMPADDGFCNASPGDSEGRLQARMDVDLSDVITIGIETTLNLHWPTPFAAVLPVALAVTIVRFSGTLAVSFVPSSSPSPPPTTPTPSPSLSKHDASHRPTTLAFTFLDDYRLDLSVRSLVGSRSRLQDVPKIAQLIEARVHAWFDDRVVEPRFQQIVLPSLWPRKHNTRGGDDIPNDLTTDDTNTSASTNTNTNTNTNETRKIDTDTNDADTLAHRIEAEGAKLRAAEVKAGERKASPQTHTQNDPLRNDGLRWRPNPSQDRPPVPTRFQSAHYAGQKGMPGAMLE